MSHFTKNSQANIIDVKAFIAAMQELGYTDIKENSTLYMYDGNHQQGVVSVTVHDKARNKDYSVGLQKRADGKYDLVGDFMCFGWVLSQKIREAMNKPGCGDLAATILKYTTKHTIVSKYRKLGYKCSVNEDQAGALQVTMTKY